MVRDCIVLAHTDDKNKKNILLKCIKNLKERDFRVIVCDHFFIKEALELADIFVYNEDNPILTPKDYEKYNLNHITPTKFEKYLVYNPVNTFAAYSIIELIKSGYKYIEQDKVLVLNYDWHLTGNVDNYFEVDKDAIFFRYASDDSVYTAMFIMSKELLSKLDEIKSIDDYAKKLVYLEWWFYDFYKAYNIEIFQDVHLKEFNANLYSRTNEKQIDFNIYKIDEKTVLVKDGNKFNEYALHKNYEGFLGNKKLSINLSDDHFKYHIAQRI